MCNQKIGLSDLEKLKATYVHTGGRYSFAATIIQFSENTFYALPSVFGQLKCNFLFYFLVRPMLPSFQYCTSRKDWTVYGTRWLCIAIVGFGSCLLGLEVEQFSQDLISLCLLMPGTRKHVRSYFICEQGVSAVSTWM